MLHPKPQDRDPRILLHFTSVSGFGDIRQGTVACPQHCTKIGMILHSSCVWIFGRFQSLRLRVTLSKCPTTPPPPPFKSLLCVRSLARMNLVAPVARTTKGTVVSGLGRVGRVWVVQGFSLFLKERACKFQFQRQA